MTHDFCVNIVCMKQAYDQYKEQEIIDQMVDLLSFGKNLSEKTRINLYLPKAVVKILDSLSQDQSRGDTVSTLVLKEANAQKKLPYGMFKGVDISEIEIDQITSDWGKVVDELS